MKLFRILLLAVLLAAPATGRSQARKFVSADDVRPASYAGKEPRFRALVYYSDHVEEAHREFTHQAIAFFRKLTVGDGFILDVDTQLPEDLSPYDVVIMPDVAPGSPEERARFQQYMENGGGWVGFHAAGYNDLSTGWPWFRDFLGGGRFRCNNWPPQPGLMEVESRTHPVTRNLPDRFVAPASEFYQWTPDPRSNPAVEVLVSLAPENFPMGLKDIVFGGDFPVVWTNRNYRMIYLNMGHGDECFSDATQNLLFVNALRWVVSTSAKGDPFDR
jgi:type 1 glutamine amidotransferase